MYWAPVPDGHGQSVHRQLGDRALVHDPPDHPAGDGIQDDAGVEPVLRGATLGEVRHPEPVGGWRREVPPRRPVMAAAMDARKPRRAHEPGHPLPAPQAMPWPMVSSHRPGAPRRRHACLGHAPDLCARNATAEHEAAPVSISPRRE